MEKSIRDKLRDGDYKNNEGYPDYQMRKSNPTVYQELVRQYNKEERRIYDQFRVDLEEDFGMKNHPMKDALFSKAWEDGHSSGFSEVLNCYDDLYEAFITPMNKWVKEQFGVNL